MSLGLNRYSERRYDNNYGGYGGYRTFYYYHKSPSTNHTEGNNH